MKRVLAFLILFFIILAILSYYLNIDRSDIDFEGVDTIVDEANEVGEDLEKNIPDFIDEQIDSFS